MFILVLGLILGLMSLYVWTRTIRATTGPGRARRVLSLVLLGTDRAAARHADRAEGHRH